MEMQEIRGYCEEFLYKMIEVRRTLHRNPELSEKEFETQAYIIRILQEEGIEYRKIADTGVLAIIRGEKEGKTIAYRADIDALPIDEPMHKEYASRNKGVMHACGHDVHTAIAIGVALFFNKIKSSLKGNVKIFFQPAEETVGGAKRMIEEGCLLNPKVDGVLGLHVMPYLECGKVELKYGTLNSSTDSIRIKVRGKSGHGAYPDKGIDAILVMSHIITALQSITSRSLSPLNSGVVTIGTISGGVKGNVIAEEVVCTGTVRSDNEENRKLILRRIDQICNGITESFEAQYEISYDEDNYAPLVNHKEVVDVIFEGAKEVIGHENIVFKEKQSMGGEDFSFFIENTPGAFYNLGCKREGGDEVDLHTKEFDVQEECMEVGLQVNVNTILKLLN